MPVAVTQAAPPSNNSPPPSNNVQPFFDNTPQGVATGVPVGQSPPVVVVQATVVQGGYVAPGSAPGPVTCMLAARNGLVCGQAAQFVCVQCRRPICFQHRRFWMNEIACAECQGAIIKDTDVMCCEVQ
mmetsp:Transcript_35779/g.111685  ORF Transcript_35779/g.111685 Transcript_35779/m.111685 type:complete len:128 (-) Transcript_35779:270-653(-)|eukprot:CAMPEP_0204606742 /NCGR_PEP_ID=MMETSP0661-20131031/59277_1 /ASSEMBLY_ACC=CAM_ASM_000606 /TAXON_ID=109239 /ORGANISM="Alexandrium margalefi, Strain AMGDE01CS-322" /LENGTH=127 /DNA_ID=CAMNT_0051618095 /DNA_START=50 /DNA_END=433 /DNA_ORIENTATION=-